MSEIREDSKITTASYKESSRSAYTRGGESAQPRSDQGKKAKKKKREKNSWRNGGLGAVNPKLTRGFFKTIQPSNLTGKRIKIQEIPFVRDAAQRLPAVHKKSLKAAPRPTAKNPLLTPCTVEPTSYETDRGKPAILTPVKAKKASSVQGLPIPRLEPESAVAHPGVPQLPHTCSLVTQPIVTSSADAHPVSRPQPLEYPAAIPPLITAVLQGDYRALERLLKDPRVNVNAQDTDGCTALHHAVRSNNMRLVRLLMSYSEIDFNIQNCMGYVPLAEAFQSKNSEIVKELIADSRVDLTVLRQPLLLKQTMSLSYPEERSSVILKGLELPCSIYEKSMVVR
ncbi:ankyrin repeat domain-containing protein [unidentified bacterial endosymbiont]|uniref:ankyrin repeat domain-containing protein n=1 Tax=unidentified bacterial endosymbiont TaxID=2355 RepID=UPI0020A1CB46|nr:ankyrin repeat domain-containing protein [unidentified bacterial endosymbiont]